MAVMKLLQGISTGDGLAIVVALALLVAAYAAFWQQSGPAERAHIQAPEQAAQVVKLEGENIVNVAGTRGESVLRIEKGRIRFIKSPCKQKYCIHAGWLNHGGDIMACLPNGVLVEVSGGKRRYDAINF